MPFGRFCFNRLAFGISSAPEHFQKRTSRVLECLEGVLCQMEDALVFGTAQAEHEQRLYAALQRIQDARITLNEKCEFSKDSVKFLGQIVHSSGIKRDAEKVQAVVAMREPVNVSEIRRVMGMVNHLGKFLPHRAERTKPL